MKRFLAAFFMLLSAVPNLYASQSSVIVESDGYACMGDDKSRKQTEPAMPPQKDIEQEPAKNVNDYILYFICNRI